MGVTEPSPSQSSNNDATLWLAFILLGAAAARFYRLGHGIPYGIGVDEPELMERVVAMMKTGDLNPHFFHYPGLYFYLLLPVVCFKFMAGAVGGQWSSLAQVSAADFYLWGRALTAALGTATVLLVFIGARRWGLRVALLSAALLAVAPLHVRESHYVLTDVPTAFFATLAWVLSLTALDRPSARRILSAGLVAGLATATKYTAGVAVIMPVLAAALGASDRRVALMFMAVAAAAGGYFAGAPYTLLDLPGFLDGFADLMRSYGPRVDDAEAGWLVYVKHFRLNFGWVATLATAFGCVLAALRSVLGADRAAWAITLLFPSVCFLSLADSSLIYARYLMPLLPLACVLGGAVAAGVSSLVAAEGAGVSRTRLANAAVGALLLAAPALATCRFSQQIAKPSTAAQAYFWIQQHVPRDSKVLLEKYELRLPPSRYRAAHVPSLVASSLDAYRTSGVQFFVASSEVYGPYLSRPTADPEKSAAYRTLFESTTELARFKPSDEVTGSELRVLALADAP